MSNAHVPGSEADLVLNAHSHREAFEETAKDREALADEALRPMSLDLQLAASTALGAYREIEPLLPAIAKDAPGADTATIQRIPVFARAAYYAQGLHQTAVVSDDQLAQTYAEALGLRDLLHTDLRSLVKRGLVGPKQLRAYKATVGYRNVATALQICVIAAREAWTKIEGKTTITLAELDRGEILVSLLVELTGVRDQAPATVAAFAKDRQRAGTLLLQAYDEARRAVSFVRWRENDADSIAPSLFSVNALKGVSRAKPEPEMEKPELETELSAHEKVASTEDALSTSVPGAPRLSPFAN